MLAIHCLGNFRLQHAARDYPFQALPKVLPLWLYLLLNRSAPLPRGQLAFTLWPDAPEAEARTNLRRHLLHLRRALPPEDPANPWLIGTTQTLQWNPLVPYWLDIAAFETLAGRPDRLDEAIALYTGPLLPTLDEAWLWFERERLHALYLDTLRRAADRHSDAGDHARALSCVRLALADDPLREPFVRRQMQLELALGDRAQALQTYTRFSDALRRELGVAPDAETQTLARQIRTNAPPAAPPAAPRVAAASPAPPAPRAAGNVPAPTRQLIGRAEALATLTVLLGAPDSPTRLVTLTGAGGVGKTRLALAVAHALASAPPPSVRDGVYVVPLAPLATPDLVLPTIAGTLGVRLNRQSPALQQLSDALRYKRLLLVLDNFEHLPAAAGDIAALLAALPDLRLLVTSQALLNLYGEQAFAVEPLRLPDPAGPPDPAALAQVPAVALFCAAAQTANSAWQLTVDNAADVAALVALLDGLPLALELAGARCRLFTPADLRAQLAQTLDGLHSRAADVPLRQRTLRAAVEWSYGLLDADEQQAFLALTLLPGGFDAETAAALCNLPSPAAALDLLERLLDRNIVRLGTSTTGRPPRFYLPYVLRAYGTAWLDAATQQTLALRRAQWFADLALRNRPRLTGAQLATLLAEYDDELDNLRATLAWGLDAAAPPVATQQAGRLLLHAVSEYCSRRALLGEGLRWLTRALTFDARLDDDLLARLNSQRAWLALLSGDYAAARQSADRTLRLAQALEDDGLIVIALQTCGLVAGHQAQYDDAEALFTQALAVARAQGEQWSVNAQTATNNLAIARKRRGDLEGAAALLRPLIDHRRAQEDWLRLASPLSELAQIYTLQGQPAAGAACFAEAWTLRFRHDDRLGIVVLCGALCDLFYREGALTMVASLLGAYLALSQQYNYALTAETRREFAQLGDDLRRQLGAAEFDAARSTGERWSLAQLDAHVQTALDALRG